MGTTKLKKQKISKKPDSSIAAPAPKAVTKIQKKLEKKEKKKKKITSQKSKPKPQLKSKSKTKINAPSSSSSDSEPDPEEIQELLQLYSKDQLIDLAIDVAASSSSLYLRIREIADKDVSHRKIFVHGLSWDTTNAILISVFQKFGEIESCNVVLDRVTGKSKGYGFVTFKTRKSALKAMTQPRMELNNRVIVWQLASLGPPSNHGQQSEGNGIGIGSGIGSGNLSGRKIYVSNVASDVSAEKLRAFFARFGEIESGPMGFDVQTGKFKGYALFVYKSVEGAKRVLEEPYKVFDGRQLHCQKAAEGKKIGGGAAGITTAVQPVPSVYTAMAAQNMAFLGQNPGVSLNPGLLSMNPLSLLANPAAIGFANMSSLGSFGQGGMGIGGGGYGGLLAHPFSNLGSGSATPMVGAYGMPYAYPSATIRLNSPSAMASDTLGDGAQSSRK